MMGGSTLNPVSGWGHPQQPGAGISRSHWCGRQKSVLLFSARAIYHRMVWLGKDFKFQLPATEQDI